MGNIPQNIPPHMYELLKTLSTNSEPSLIEAGFYSFIAEQSTSQVSLLKPLFASLSLEQVLVFSSNIIKIIQKMITSKKLNHLQITCQIAICFTEGVYSNLPVLQELLTQTVSKDNFPYNIFALSLDLLTNDNFLFQTDIFQREIDKFSIIYDMTYISFFIVHKSANSFEDNKEMCDNVKLFLICDIEEKTNLSLLSKMYNTTIHNLENVVNRRVDPQIEPEKFEHFIYMNLYTLNYYLTDINRIVLTAKNESQNSQLDTIKSKMKKITSEISKLLMSSSNFFRKFVLDFLTNNYLLSISFQYLVKIFLIFVFETNRNICEMLCLNEEIITQFLAKISMKNAPDLIILYFMTKTDNFNIALKHLNRSSSQLCSNCLLNALSIFSQDHTLTYCVYFSLLTACGFANSLSEIEDDSIKNINELYSEIAKLDITIDNCFDNAICLSILYETIFAFVKHLDAPAKIIYCICVKKKEIEELNQKYQKFYKENLESKGLGKRIWARFTDFSNGMEMFIKEIDEKIKNENEDLAYSSENICSSIINKGMYKDKNWVNGGLEFIVFGGEVEKFLISGMREIDEFNVLI